MIDILQNGNLVWAGKQESLFQICAEMNIERVNKLGLRELWCALAAATNHPFPLGEEEYYYRGYLKIYDSGKIKKPDIRTEEEKKQSSFLPDDYEVTNQSLGRFRIEIVYKSGDQINAPIDTYLKIAVKVKEEENVT